MECDKNNFVCIKLYNDSIYYGEVAYLDKDGNIVKKEDIDALEPKEDEEGNPIDPMLDFRRVRHGLGVQIFGAKSIEFESKYEGEWLKDNMHG